MLYSTTAVFTDSSQPMSIRQLPIPELGPREILVRNEYATLCRSDLNTYSGKRSEAVPTILGHEVVGRIVGFGVEAPRTDVQSRELRLGTRVSWAIFSSDPDSMLSKEGMPQKGERLTKYGHEQLTPHHTLHGGLSEYIILRENTPVAALSEEVSLPVAALTNCALATVAGALRLLGNMYGKNVLVVGGGMLGLAACAMLRATGVASLTVLEQDPRRLAQAAGFGADYLWSGHTDMNARSEADFECPQPFHGLIECSGSPEAMEDTLDLLQTGGRAVWVGATHPGRKLQLTAEKIIRKILTIKGLHNYNTTDFATAVNFVEKYHDRYPFLGLIKGPFRLAEVDIAFAYALKTNPFRVGIELI